MNTSQNEPRTARAVAVEISHTTVQVELTDGRTIAVPVSWYPRLDHGTSEERANWRFIAEGEGLHWPELDEDISVEDLLLGRPSGESQRSLKRWLDTRRGQAA